MKQLLSMAVVGLALLSTNAFGQGRGFDEFGEATTIQMLPGQLMTASLLTNATVDEHVFNGTAKIDINIATNGPGKTFAWLYTSPDLTNYTALANWALATNLSVKMTNFMYGATNMFVTNTYSSSGVQTTPTSATAGFATTYFVPQSFTNNFGNAPLEISKSGTYTIGYDIDDAGRYIQLVLSNGASGMTNGVSAVLTTHKANQINVIQ